MSTTKKLVLWTLTLVPAAMFLFAGTMKLTALEKVTPMFQHYGYPPWFAVVTAVLEVGGGILVLLPRTAWLGASALAAVGAGATLTHLVHHEAAHALVPFVLFLMSIAVLYLRRDGLMRFLGKGRARAELAGKEA